MIHFASKGNNHETSQAYFAEWIPEPRVPLGETVRCTVIDYEDGAMNLTKVREPKRLTVGCSLNEENSLKSNFSVVKLETGGHGRTQSGYFFGILRRLEAS